MFYRRAGLPEESELVMCTVSKIQYNAVFALLDEYDKTGMIHISEISPGRIRNIRDYVKEGKKIVCVVLRVDEKKGYIDLSLRRVSDGQRRRKVNELKQELTAEKIIEFLAKQQKKEVKALYDEVTGKVFEKFGMLHPCFQKVVAGELKLTELGIAKKLADELTELILQRIKPPLVEISGKLYLQTYADDGVEVIKKSLTKGLEAGGEDMTITYAGAGAYNVHITAKDYKIAEKNLKKGLDTVEKYLKKAEGSFRFERKDKK